MSDPAVDRDDKAKPVEITINQDHFVIESPIMGSELRSLGHIPATNQLFEERPGPDVLVEPTVSYKVKEDAHFYDLPVGTVGW